MWPMWLCILLFRRLTEAYDMNTEWRKVRPMQPMWLQKQTNKCTNPPDKSRNSLIRLPGQFIKSVPLDFTFILPQFCYWLNNINVILTCICTLRIFWAFISELVFRFCTNWSSLHNWWFLVLVLGTKFWSWRGMFCAPSEDFDPCCGKDSDSRHFCSTQHSMRL